MHYENRQPPEGINVVEHGWARDFALLVLGVFAALALACWLLLQVLSWSARWVPFSWETALTRSWQPEAESQQTQQYLQSLADSLASAGGLPSDLQVIVHYEDHDLVNAFATLGGHVVAFQGLIDAVESEQGLAFVLAHEIAHVHYRHPLQALARGVGLSAVMALVFGQSDLGQLAGFGGNFALLDYSRQQEREADAWALNALFHHYGHTAGAEELFVALKAEMSQTEVVPEWLSTHPDLAVRVERLRSLARERGYKLEGSTTPLPDHVVSPLGPRDKD